MEPRFARILEAEARGGAQLEAGEIVDRVDLDVFGVDNSRAMDVHREYFDFGELILQILFGKTRKAALEVASALVELMNGNSKASVPGKRPGV